MICIGCHQPVDETTLVASWRGPNGITIYHHLHCGWNPTKEMEWIKRINEQLLLVGRADINVITNDIEACTAEEEEHFTVKWMKLRDKVLGLDKL